MFKFLLVLAFFFAILVLLTGFSIVRGIQRALFGRPKQSQAKSNQNKAKQKKTVQDEVFVKKQDKYFAPDEGEYVEYEEITDSSTHSSPK